MTDLRGESIHSFQRFCIETNSLRASFALFNGRGFAQCRWVNALLGLFQFEETGEVACALNVPDFVTVFGTIAAGEAALEHYNRTAKAA